MLSGHGEQRQGETVAWEGGKASPIGIITLAMQAQIPTKRRRLHSPCGNEGKRFLFSPFSQSISFSRSISFRNRVSTFSFMSLKGIPLKNR